MIELSDGERGALEAVAENTCFVSYSGTLMNLRDMGFIEACDPSAEHRCGWRLTEKGKVTINPLRWRIGAKLGRTLYMGDRCIGMVDTPGLAIMIVQAMNAVEDGRSISPEQYERVVVNFRRESAEVVRLIGKLGKLYELADATRSAFPRVFDLLAGKKVNRIGRALYEVFGDPYPPPEPEPDETPG